MAASFSTRPPATAARRSSSSRMARFWARICVCGRGRTMPSEGGSAPLVVATAMVGVWSELIGFFSLYYGFRHNRPLLLFLFSILGPLVGVLVWNRLCKRNRWPFLTLAAALFALSFGVIFIVTQLLQAFGADCEVLVVESAEGRPVSGVLSFYFRDEVLPWLEAHHRGTRKIINVVGRTTDDFITVIQTLEEVLGTGPVERSEAVSGYELNVSCPNVKAGGLEFGADPKALATIVGDARAATRRPIFVKLSPTLPDIAAMAQVAEQHGADVISLVNTLPGLVIDLVRRKPSLSFGSGGVSGPGLLPVGVLATWRVRQAVRIPLMGIGGVASAEDALQYIMAGATLVGVGTTAMKDPRRPERIVAGLARWCDREGVRRMDEIIGALEWPA